MRLRRVDAITPELLDRVGRLRAAVWREEGHLLPGVCRDGRWLEALDPVASHWLVEEGGELVAAARLSLHRRAEEFPYAAEFAELGIPLPVPFGYLARLVVSRGWRRRGLARALDCARLEHARAAGARRAVVLATPYRVEPLQRLGFLHLGPSPVPAEARADLSLQAHLMVHPLAS